MNKAFDDMLQSRLDERKRSGLYRELHITGPVVDLSSNDYLGFARHHAFAAGNHSDTQGATGSRLISGNSPEAISAETYIAKFYGVESALIFNCGYMANIGLFSTLAGKHDTWIHDEYIHASILDGMRLSHASRYKFRHNDLQDLEKKLKAASGNIFVAVESLYSMDGDMAPLQEMITLCKTYDAKPIVDEAHATGVFGESGKGLVAAGGWQHDVYATVVTFGKALGLHGAAVIGSQILCHYLVNFARPFIYSTALPPDTYKSIESVYRLLPQADTQRKVLMELVTYFREAAMRYPRLVFKESQSQIQALMIGDQQKAKDLSAHLLTKGIYAKAILSPTVAEGTERLRICLHTFNTAQQVDLLLNEIHNFRR
jgi:8-amino-7-oxononanoate synthase